MENPNTWTQLEIEIDDAIREFQSNGEFIGFSLARLIADRLRSAGLAGSHKPGESSPDVEIPLAAAKLMVQALEDCQRQLVEACYDVIHRWGDDSAEDIAMADTVYTKIPLVMSILRKSIEIKEKSNAAGSAPNTNPAATKGSS
jgi:hypothetical protein